LKIQELKYDIVRCRFEPMGEGLYTDVTSAVATILKEVKNNSFVVITGPSGIGKSTIVKLVALQLQNSDGYHILHFF
jgi:ABC-type lipoprotein export system ATPase subunit